MSGVMTDQRKYPHDLAAMVAWIRSHAPPGARVLEIGCGDGALVDVLASEFDVVGVDPNASASERIVAGSFEALDETPFDLVFASVSLHHLHDEEAAVDALRRLTRPGTMMLVREFDRECQDHVATLQWWYDRKRAMGAELPNFDDFAGNWREQMRRHVWPWAKVKSMLERAGFRTIEEVETPYMFRWELEETDRADEERAAAEGRIRLVGRQWTGQR